MNASRSRLAAVAAALALVGGACGDDDTGTNGNRDDAGGGEVVVTGSSTVQPISSRVAEKFNEANPDVAVSVDSPGTGDGFEAFCNGEADMTNASRPIQPEEIDVCEGNGVEFIELKVGIDGLSVITAAGNGGVECLSFLDLYALLGPESQGFDRWSDADDLAGELEGELAGEFGESHAPYPDDDLVVTGPGEESGTYDSFVELALADISEQRGTEEATRPDYQASPNDNVILEGVGGSPSALGWVGFAFVEESAGAVHAVAVDGGDGCVEPTPETISGGRFPLARDLFVYVDAAEAADNPALAGYVDFYLSDEGIASVTEVGYIAVPDADLEATRAAWESKETGTREG